MAFGIDDLVGAVAGAYASVQEKKQQENAAQAAYEEKARQAGLATGWGLPPGHDGGRAGRTATRGEAETQEDYAAKMDEFRRSQHLQGLMKREQLASRGITSPTSGTIPQSEYGLLGAEQKAAGGGIESWRTRKLADIGENLSATQENVETAMKQAEVERKAGQFNWSDYLRSVAPSAYAGGTVEALKTMKVL